MNALVAKMNSPEPIISTEFLLSLLFNAIIVVVILDYILHRILFYKNFKMFEMLLVDSHQQTSRGNAIMKEAYKNFEQQWVAKVADLNEKIQFLSSSQEKLKNDINHEFDNLEDYIKRIEFDFDKVDDGYDNLSRNFLLLQSRLSESCENNSDRMTKLEETLNENYPHISLLTEKIETFNQFLEVINKNVFKVDQKYYELKEMMTKELDEIQQGYLSLYDECKERMDKSDQKINLQIDVVSVLKEFMKKYLRVYFPVETMPPLHTFDEDGYSLQGKFNRQQQQRTDELREFGAKYSIENW